MLAKIYMIIIERLYLKANNYLQHAGLNLNHSHSKHFLQCFISHDLNVWPSHTSMRWLRPVCLPGTFPNLPLSLLSPLARSRQRLTRLVAVTISADSCLSTTGTRHPPPSPGTITPLQYIQYSTVQYSTVQYCLSTTGTRHPPPSPGTITPVQCIQYSTV